LNGSIQSAGDSFNVSFTTKGKRIRRRFGSMTQAEGYLMDLRRASIAGKPLPETENNLTTWQELKDQTYTLVWKGAKSENTSKLNSDHVVRYFGASTPVAHFTQGDLDNWVVSLKALGNSDATINRKLSCLSRMLRFALERGLVTKRFIFPIKKETKGRIRFVTPEEEAVILSKASDKLKPLFIFLLYTGARVGEALKLTWADFNWTNKVVTFWDTKSGESRSIPMTTSLVIVMNELMEVGGDSPFGHIKQFEVNRAWTSIRDQMGLTDDKEFVPHSLRHTCASRLVQRGVPIVVVKEWLGHKTIQMTMRYAHLAPTNLLEAVGALEA
jgi:integrase